jgi:hypothetical protein
MAKINNRTQELFKAQLAARKKENDKTTEINEKERMLILPNNIDKIFKIPENIYEKLTNDKELINYLNSKTFELLKINGAGNIIIGKILYEVAEELGKKGSSEGLYLSFLEVAGYKKDTALRFRKRYELYKKVNTDEAKQIISLMSIKLVEKLYKEQELLNKIDIKEMDYKTASEIINKETEIILIDETEEKKEFIFEMNELPFLQTQIEEKYDNLNQREKDKLNKLLFEIKILLEK